MSDRDDRPLRLRLRAWLVAASVPALLLAGCGAGGDEIPSSDAETLRAQLDELQGLVAAGDCEGADTQLDEVNETVTAIEERESVDPEIRRGLRRLTDQLNRTFTDDACAPEEDPVEVEPVEPVEPVPAPEPPTTEPEPEPEEPTAPPGRGPDGGGPPGQDGGSTPPGSGTGGIGEEEDD